jgi:hypothetical protein
MWSGDVVDKMLPRLEGYKAARPTQNFFVPTSINMDALSEP